MIHQTRKALPLFYIYFHFAEALAYAGFTLAYAGLRSWCDLFIINLVRMFIICKEKKKFFLVFLFSVSKSGTLCSWSSGTLGMLLSLDDIRIKIRTLKMTLEYFIINCNLQFTVMVQNKIVLVFAKNAFRWLIWGIYMVATSSALSVVRMFIHNGVEIRNSGPG